jgi:hypothetical protein
VQYDIGYGGSNRDGDPFRRLGRETGGDEEPERERSAFRNQVRSLVIIAISSHTHASSKTPPTALPQPTPLRYDPAASSGLPVLNAARGRQAGPSVGKVRSAGVDRMRNARGDGAPYKSPKTRMAHMRGHNSYANEAPKIKAIEYDQDGTWLLLHIPVSASGERWEIMADGHRARTSVRGRQWTKRDDHPLESTEY